MFGTSICFECLDKRKKICEGVLLSIAVVINWNDQFMLSNLLKLGKKLSVNKGEFLFFFALNKKEILN